MSTKSVIYALGYAGLIPFVMPALWIVLDWNESGLLIELVGAYAFGIVCFLTGSWWGIGLEPGKRTTLLLSNIYFLIAFFVFVFARELWLPAAVVLLVSIFMTERIASLFPGLKPGYRKMRAILSLVASASMVVTFLAA